MGATASCGRARVVTTNQCEGARAAEGGDDDVENGCMALSRPWSSRPVIAVQRSHRFSRAS